MRLTIVRHAFAGQKRGWTRPDLERPLDAVGRQQAIALVALLGRRVTRIVTSPAVRCIQTVTPFAEVLGVDIELWPRIGPDGLSSDLSMCFVDDAFDGAVVCTHGELLQPLAERVDISRLARGQKIKRDTLLTKGSAWRLHIDPTGNVTKLTHLVPTTHRQPRLGRRTQIRCAD
jgi:phosphohistidine phosphatase SixA